MWPKVFGVAAVLSLIHPVPAWAQTSDGSSGSSLCSRQLSWESVVGTYDGRFGAFEKRHAGAPVSEGVPSDAQMRLRPVSETEFLLFGLPGPIPEVILRVVGKNGPPWSEAPAASLSPFSSLNIGDVEELQVLSMSRTRNLPVCKISQFPRLIGQVEADHAGPKAIISFDLVAVRSGLLMGQFSWSAEAESVEVVAPLEMRRTSYLFAE